MLLLILPGTVSCVLIIPLTTIPSVLLVQVISPTLYFVILLPRSFASGSLGAVANTVFGMQGVLGGVKMFCHAESKLLKMGPQGIH